MSRTDEILSFWFSEPRNEQQYYDERRKLWFASEPRIDQNIRDQFLVDYERAAAHELQDWIATPRSALALILLYDQFPRNMFRGESARFRHGCSRSRSHGAPFAHSRCSTTADGGT